jgi:hypothetical protein
MLENKSRMTYELKQIRGIPYYLNGTTVRTFEPNSVPIGTYDSKTDSITYFTDWRTIIQPNLDAFRAAIHPTERDKLRESITKPAKPRKTTRTPRKTSASTSAKSK